MLRRIDRYLVAEIVGPFLAALLFLFALLFAMQALRGIDVFLGAGVHARDLVRIAAFLSPHFVAMAMPISFLFAVVLAIGRLSEDRETVALAASGAAPWRLWVAPVALATLVAGFGFVLGEGPDPRGLAALRLQLNELIKRNMAGDVRPGVFYDALDNMVLYAQSVEPTSRRFGNVLVCDERDKDASILVLAHSGEVDPAGGGSHLKMVLGDGEMHRIAFDERDYALATFQRAVFDVAVGGILRKNVYGMPKEEMTPDELTATAGKARAEGREQEARSFELARERRRAAPLASVVFALCGVPLALTRRARSRALGAMAALTSYVGYYVIGRWAEVASEAGRLPPALAAQAANLAFLALAVVLVRRATRAE